MNETVETVEAINGTTGVIETVNETILIVLECLSLVFSAVITVYYMYRKCIKTVESVETAEKTRDDNEANDGIVTHTIADNKDEVTTDDCEKLSKSPQIVSRGCIVDDSHSVQNRPPTKSKSTQQLHVIDPVINIKESDIRYKSKSHSYAIRKRNIVFNKITLENVVRDNGRHALRYSVQI